MPVYYHKLGHNCLISYSLLFVFHSQPLIRSYVVRLTVSVFKGTTKTDTNKWGWFVKFCEGFLVKYTKGFFLLWITHSIFPVLRRGKTTEHWRAVNILCSHLFRNPSMDATLILKSFFLRYIYSLWSYRCDAKPTLRRKLGRNVSDFSLYSFNKSAYNLDLTHCLK